MIYLVFSIIFMVLLAVVTRKATAAGCGAFSFNAIARYVSGAVMLIFSLLTVKWPDIWQALKAAGWLGAVGGFLFSAATIGATKSVQYGPLGISWTILRCSMVISTLASLLVWREIPPGFNRHFLLCLLGIIFTVGTVIIFGVAKILRNHSAKKLSLKWFLFAMMAFWGQGAWEVLLRSTRSIDIAGFRGNFYHCGISVFRRLLFSGAEKYRAAQLEAGIILGMYFRYLRNFCFRASGLGA